MTRYRHGVEIQKRFRSGTLIEKRFVRGRQVFGGDAAPLEPAGDHYIHSVWGNTSKLTPPRALAGSPMILFDLHRSQPSGGFTQSNVSLQSGETVGGDGQTVNARWVPITRNRWGPDSYQQYWGDPQRHYTTLDHPVSRIENRWLVTINGNGADVWIDCTRGPNVDWEFQLTVENCRTFRLTGARWFITDLRNISGGWPDEGNQFLYLKDVPPNGQYFIEGCDIDANHGGRSDTPMFRTDLFQPRAWSKENSALIIQNSRVHRYGSNISRPESHTDVMQPWGLASGSDTNTDNSGAHMRHLHLENFEAYFYYQGIYFNSNNRLDSSQVGCVHRLYRVRMTSTQDPAYSGNAGQAPLLLGVSGIDASDNRASPLHAEDTEVVFRADPLAWGRITDGWSGGVRTTDNVPTLSSAYLNGSSNIPLYWAYNGGSDVLTQKANVDGSRRLNGFKWYDLGSNDSQYRGYNTAGYSGMGTRAPANQIGHNYVPIWNQDGRLTRISHE